MGNQLNIAGLRQSIDQMCVYIESRLKTEPNNKMLQDAAHVCTQFREHRDEIERDMELLKIMLIYVSTHLEPLAKSVPLVAEVFKKTESALSSLKHVLPKPIELIFPGDHDRDSGRASLEARSHRRKRKRTSKSPKRSRTRSHKTKKTRKN